MIKTFDNYIADVKQQIAIAKQETFGGYLTNPSPAQLRNYCLLLFDGGLSQQDAEIFKLFFQPNGEESLRKKIDSLDAGKWRAVGNFIRGENSKTNPVNLNLIAVLVNFKPRPHNAYIAGKNQLVNAVSDIIHDTDSSNSVDMPEDSVNATTIYQEDEIIKDNTAVSVGNRKKFIAILLIVIVLLFVCISAILLFPEKKFMQWQTDHYTTLEDNQEELLTADYGAIRPIDGIEIKKRQLQLADIPYFFRNEKPMVWYSKEVTGIEFFNIPGDGLHPISGKTLKPISKYMIDKYKLNKKHVSASK
ncbi:MAG: hypothetical protein PSV16_06120 [Flavobacterium sp.]|nr:hypothetical protein [Flavobacterium sp.]